MRFQVQWGTSKGGPTFSEKAPSTGIPSVTPVAVSQAVAALERLWVKVTPAARQASRPAIEKAIRFVRARPPYGIGPAQQEFSFPFNYLNFTDARVDVTNQRGHDLRW